MGVVHWFSFFGGLTTRCFIFWTVFGSFSGVLVVFFMALFLGFISFWVSGRQILGYDVALIDRYPADEYCEEPTAFGESG